jgi:hypothetical protein
MNALTQRRTFWMICAAILGMAFPGIVDAHRLDEYLQATRISIGAGRVLVEMNLTPGAAVAESVMAMIDRDQDGEISSGESLAYAESVVGSVSLGIDGEGHSLGLDKYRFPSAAQIRRGEGIIRLHAAATVPRVSPGPHRLVFANRHRSDIGVYLVNALVPVDDRIRIKSQSRDFLQREYGVEYTVEAGKSSARAASISSVVGLALAAVAYAVSRRQRS